MIKKFSKFFALFLTGAMIFTGCSSKNADTETSSKTPATEKIIKVGSANTAVPYSYVENDVHKGFEVDMWAEISKRTGIKPEFTVTGFSTLFGLLDTGKIDVVGNFIGMSPERLEKYNFSTPYAYTSINIAVAEGNTDIKSVEDLKGKTVAICEGTEGQQAFLRLNTDGKIKSKVYGDGTSGTQDLNLKRVDAYIESKLTLAQEIAATKAKIKVLDEPISGTKVGYPYKKDNENVAKLMEDINKALKDMLSDGTIKTLSEKWFNTDIAYNGQ